MRLEIQREPAGASSSEAGVVPSTLPDASPVDEPLQQDEHAEEGDAVASSISLSPGLLLGFFTLVVGCVVLAGSGVWLAGQVGGVGPLAAAPTLRRGPSMNSGRRSGQAPVPAAAVVNGEPITVKQIDELIAINIVMASLENGEPLTLTPQQWQQARSELLNQAIRNTLILQAARGAGITVSQEQAQAEWLAWLRKYDVTPDQLDAQLAQAGASREVLQDWLGNALAANLYLRQYVAPGAEDEERQKAYEQWIEQQLSTAQIQRFAP